MTASVDVSPREASPAVAEPRSRRDDIAIAVFGTWMITGLFIDGWAHQAEKPETFFSPWHGILYSGFVAALVWFAWDGRREEGAASTGPMRGLRIVPRRRGLATIGLVVFITGAVGDGVWHEIFGVEADLEALLSPTHLLLLIGGFLMVTEPVRAAVADRTERSPSLRAFLPQAVCVTLATALVSFFTMYLSAFEDPVADESGIAGGAAAELVQVEGLASVLATNLLLISAMVFVLRRWHAPAGTFTLLFGVVAFAMTGLQAFESIEFVAPAVLAGVFADAAPRRAPPLAVATLVPVVLWSAYFAVAHMSYGVAWTPDLWAGAIVLCAAMGALLTAVASSGDRVAT